MHCLLKSYTSLKRLLPSVLQAASSTILPTPLQVDVAGQGRSGEGQKVVFQPVIRTDGILTRKLTLDK